MTDTMSLSEKLAEAMAIIQRNSSIILHRVECEVCGCGFVHRQGAQGRRRRFCSAACRHIRELEWKATWRAANRQRKAPADQLSMSLFEPETTGELNA